METGSVLDAIRNGPPRTSAGNIESVRQVFSRSTKSIRTAARELELPLTRRVASGGAGGAMPPRFSFLPPRFFLAPTVFF